MRRWSEGLRRGVSAQRTSNQAQIRPMEPCQSASLGPHLLMTPTHPCKHEPRSARESSPQAGTVQGGLLVGRWLVRARRPPVCFIASRAQRECKAREVSPSPITPRPSNHPIAPRSLPTPVCSSLYPARRAKFFQVEGGCVGRLGISGWALGMQPVRVEARGSDVMAAQGTHTTTGWRSADATRPATHMQAGRVAQALRAQYSTTRPASLTRRRRTRPSSSRRRSHGTANSSRRRTGIFMTCA